MYSKKQLRYEFTVKNGAYDKDGNDKISISNVKSSLRMGSYGNYGGSQAEITIFGLGTELLSTLSSKGIGIYTLNTDTKIDAYVGDTKVYSGGIYASYANMNGQPETALILNAVSGLSLKTSSSASFSLPGAVDVSKMLSAICQVYGYGFNSTGLDGVTEQNPHYSGSPMDQIRDICETHKLWYQIFDDVLTVWPSNSSKKDDVPFVSADSGLIGYPVFTQSGITFQTQFSTLLSQGRVVELETALPNASGRYLLTVVEHFLTSWTDGGSWHTVSQGVRRQDG
ncbi:baseplate hub protein [Lonsdalea quercina]|uniref:baseplate hub protein n=1 Tax=Lonsdalea quercina TaxID=71657 RepID=UPI003976F35A